MTSALSKPGVRARIVDAARERFVESGYGAASIASIAVRAGVATETVYDVFGSKRALLEAMIDATIRGADAPDGTFFLSCGSG